MIAFLLLIFIEFNTIKLYKYEQTFIPIIYLYVRS